MPKRTNTRITDKTVRHKPSDKPIEIRDCDLRGFILRIQPTGTKTYYLQLDRGKRSRIGDANVMTLTQARDEAKKRISNGKNGEVPESRIKSNTPTLKKFIDEHYLDWAVQNQKCGKANAVRILATFPDLSGIRLDKITAWEVEKWKSERKKSGIKAATINRELQMLKAALNKAVEWHLLDNNVTRPVKTLKGGDNSRVRFLSPNEAQRLLDALDARENRIRTQRRSANRWRLERECELLPEIADHEYADHMKPMVILSMNTGLRFGELTSLTWENVSLEQQANLTVLAGHSKSGKTRHVSLNSEARGVLEVWQKQTQGKEGYIFPSPKGGKLTTVKTAWKPIRTEAKLVDFKWHDLRHDFASKLVMAGVDLNTVRELLGHGSLQMTLRYAHLAPEHKATAVETIVKLKAHQGVENEIRQTVPTSPAV